MTTMMTQQELKAHWAKIRNRRRGLFGEMSPVDAAAAELSNQTMEQSITHVRTLIRPFDGPGTFWAEVLTILVGAR